MKYTIGQTGDEVTIDLSGTVGRTPQVLEALHECTGGPVCLPHRPVRAARRHGHRHDGR